MCNRIHFRNLSQQQHLHFQFPRRTSHYHPFRTILPCNCPMYILQYDTTKKKKQVLLHKNCKFYIMHNNAIIQLDDLSKEKLKVIDL